MKTYGKIGQETITRGNVMKTTGFALGLAVLLAAANVAQAVIIVNWQSPQLVAASSDVSTLGHQVFGMTANPSDAYPAVVSVNGANFASGNPAWSVTLSSNFTNPEAGDGPASVGGPDAANYKSVLDSTGYTSNYGNFGTVTLGNLRIGHNYQFQFWEGLYQPSGQRSETISSSVSDINIPTLSWYKLLDGFPGGEYVIGTFTATDLSITFTVDSSHSALYSAPAGAQYEAFQLRDLTVPEPSVAALLLLGLGGLWVRNRQRSAISGR